WLDAAQDRQQTALGLAIRWQRAVAALQLAIAPGISKADQLRWQNSAAADAREGSRFPGEFQARALEIAGRLISEQSSKRDEPRDFSSAFNIARKMMTDLQMLKERIESSKEASERTKLTSERQTMLLRTAAHLRTTLEAARNRIDP